MSEETGKFWVHFPEFGGDAADENSWREVDERAGSYWRLSSIAEYEAELACSDDCDLYASYLSSTGCPVWVKGEDGVIHKFTVYGEQVVEFRAVEDKA